MKQEMDIKCVYHTLDESVYTTPAVLTVPVGFGKVAIGFGKTNEVNDKESIIMSFAKLEKVLQPQSTLDKDQLEYVQKHPLVHLVISKDYIPHLIELLQEQLQN